MCRTCLGPHFTPEAITFDSTKILTCSAPQNDRQHLSFGKNKYTYGEKMARKDHEKAIYKVTFIWEHTLSGITFAIH